VTRDPRWDRQVESRADYYAQLILARALSIVPLVRRLWNRDGPSQETSTTLLLVDTLGRLAVRGHGGALAIVRDYLRWGVWWATAFAHLGDARQLRGTEAVVERRFPGDQLVGALQGLEIDPWRAGISPESAVGRILSMHEQRRSCPRQESGNFAGLTTEDLFWNAGDGAARRFVEELVHRDERALLRKRAASPAQPGANVALIALACLRDRCTRDLAVASLATPRLPILSRVTANRALTLLEAATVLPLAREWFESAVPYRRRAAEAILEVHAEDADLFMLTGAIDQAMKDGDGYRLCAVVDGLARLRAVRAIPWLQDVYVSADYAFVRLRAARALADVDAGFAEREGVECLWDAEPGVRAFGAARAASGPRLRELASDRFEADPVRSAARARLLSSACY
jgi:hypothetical protein